MSDPYNYQQPTPPYQPVPVQQQLYPYVAPRPGNGLAVASMILGILSLMFWWWGLVDLGGLVVLSIVFGAAGIRRATAGAPHHGMAVAGLTCGIIGLVGYIAWGIATLGAGFII